MLLCFAYRLFHMRGLGFSRVLYATLLFLSLTASACDPSGRGSLLVYSEPASSSLYVDGVYMGLTPEGVVGVEPGVHEIALTLRRYGTFKTTVEVEPCRTSTLKAELEPLPYSPLTGYAVLDQNPTGGQGSQTPFAKALGSSRKEITIAQSYSSDEIIPADIRLSVPSITVSGSVQLQDDLSYARIIMQDASGLEYLVYSTDELGFGAGKYDFQDACVETCEMKSVKPARFRVEVSGATITLKSLDYAGGAQVSIASAGDNTIKAKKDMQLKERIRKLNERIKRNGEGWVAGDTPVARMTYEEKKALFFNNEVPNLYGFDTYVGGIFKLPDEVVGASSIGDGTDGYSPGLSLPASFDWRKRHGENWLTPVRNQASCGSCWAHGTLGSIEGAINMQYNQHINADLSEQDLVSCFHGYGCSGAYIGQITDLMRNYMRVNGTPDEACFPYTATDSNKCINRCSTYQSRVWRTSGATLVPPSIEAVKRAIVQNGSLHMIDYGWSHAITAVGYGYNGSDFYVIFKNSWGSGWGEGGYARKVITPSQIMSSYLFYAVNAPFTPPQGVTYNVSCSDLDGDGYCNWGIGPKPVTCPGTCNQWPDVDDSNASLGAVEDCATPGDEDGNGLLDCADPACPLGYVCSPDMTRFCNPLKACMPRENCTAAGDEDGNGLLDCADPACPAGIVCSPDMTRFCNPLKACMPRENCTAVGDEDGDGLPDCADSDCPSGTYCNLDHSKRCDNTSRCILVENCQLPGDEDGNRLADCLDTASCPDATYCSADYQKACFDTVCKDLAKILTSATESSGGTGISGNWVIWSEYSFLNGFGVNVFVYDITSKTRTKVNSVLLNVTWDLPKISGSKVVYEHSGDIYLYDILSSSTTRLTSDSGWQNSPSISPDAVAWIDNTRNSTVYYDLTTKTSREIPAVKAMPAYPTVGGGKVAWQEQPQGIFVYDLATSTLRNVTDNPNSSPPLLGGGKVYYVIFGGGVGGPTARGIYSYDPASGTTSMVATGDWLPFRFSISGGRLVWSGNLDTKIYSGPQVLLTDLSNHATSRIPFAGVQSPLPMISGDRIVWAIEKTIFLYELQAQPAESCDTPGDEDGNGHADCLDPICEGRYCDTWHTRVCQSGECAPAAGNLIVDSRPAGADAILDGAPKGKTPLSVDGVAPGIHDLSLTLTGQIPYETTVNISSGKTTILNVTLAAATGNLSITSNPLAASVAINGVPKGATPLIVSGILPGGYTVVMTKPNYQSSTQAASVEAGKTTSVFATLVPVGGSINVTSNPTCASVNVDGLYIGGCTPLLTPVVIPGNHVLTIYKSGYVTQNKTVVVYSGKTTLLSVILAPLWGTLNVSSTPAGASVKLNGESVGVTPLSRNNLLPGAYNVTVSLDGYIPYSTKVAVYAGKTTAIKPTLISLYGAIYVKSTPSGARVELNGQNRGITPLNITGLLPGKYNVSVKLENHLPYTAAASVVSGKTTVLNPTLVFYFGGLSVSSKPLGADVRVNEDFVGKTPLNVTGLAPGKYNVTVHLGDYVDYKVVAAVASGKVTSVVATLVYYFGNISAGSVPSGAQVTVNGESVGVTPVYLSNLTPGKYNVSFSLADHLPYNVIATVYSGKTTVLKPTLTYYFGNMTLITKPAGATALVNGVAVSGVTPLTVVNLPPGAYNVSLSLENYVTYNKSVIVYNGKNTILNQALTYYFGSLALNSRPSGASVSVNDAPVGVTPKTLSNLNPGKYNVSFTLADYLVYNVSATVNSGLTTTLNPTLVWVYGNLSVTSTPTGASVTVDGVAQGVTPKIVPGLNPGVHNVTVSMSGYVPSSRTATVIQGKTTALSVILVAG